MIKSDYVFEALWTTGGSIIIAILKDLMPPNLLHFLGSDSLGQLKTLFAAKQLAQ